MRVFVVVLSLFVSSIVRADCVKPQPLVNGGVVQLDVCGEGLAAEGDRVQFRQIPQLPIFTAAQINSADLSDGAGLIVGCSNCNVNGCWICASTGSITGQTACVGGIGGGKGLACR